MKYMLKCSTRNYEDIKNLIDSYSLEYSHEYDLLFVSKSFDDTPLGTFISFSEDDLTSLKSYLSVIRTDSVMSEKLMVKDGSAIIPLSKCDITHIYAGNNKCYVVADDEYTINLKLLEIDNKLKGDGFLRINKSQIVNLNKITSIKSWFSNRYLIHLNSNLEFVVTGNYYKSFKKSIGL